VAEELLYAEGFKNIQYVKAQLGRLEKVAAGEADIGINFSGPILRQLDADDPISVLAGVHPGCFELFATDGIRSVADLKGKTVGVWAMNSSAHVFISSMAAYVGLDPQNDINWVIHPRADAAQLLDEGKIQAYMAFAPQPQLFRAQGVRARVIVNSSVDRPWSQYFCCMVVANRNFVTKHPIATKRALRAILKSIDVCAQEPERVARIMQKKGVAFNYEATVQAYREIPYLNAWREFDPEDTLRFYALRLHEARMVTLSPQKLIARGADWRFLDQLKRELKV
jgi:NitT/TauT family transport system substrate-binding protein